jgi:minor extracellular serine protease Vpr
VAVLYATGLGPVTPAPPSGAPASASPLSTCQTQPLLLVSQSVAEVLFCGLAPGFVGLYQVNFRIPPGLGRFTLLPVTVTVAGRSSNAGWVVVN